jgi:outer membrane protein TolC
VSWPVLDWGRIRGNIRVQNELQQQALVAYEDTLWQALKEVEDALVEFAKEQGRQSALADAARFSQTALDLARERYAKGLVDLLTVLTAQRSLLAAQDALARSQAAVRNDLVRLYLALGGGWE